MIIKIGSNDDAYTWAVEYPGDCYTLSDFKAILRLAAHHNRIPKTANQMAREILGNLEAHPEFEETA